MKLSVAFLASFFLALAFVDAARPGPCGQSCKFRLCNFNGERFTIPKASFLILGAPQTAQLPYICRPDDTMGQVLKTGQAQVRVGNKFVPISQWSPSGLQRNFRNIFLRPFKVPFLPHSGVGPLSSSPNQWSFLHDQCMILPVTRYERIDEATGRPTKILNASGKDDCVAFRTSAPAIHVELIWDTPDDFDLEVEEPDGDVLSYRNKRTEFGKLNGDNNVNVCSTKLLFGKENVIYFPNPSLEKGQYKIRVIHFNKCADRPTNWKLRVVVNGKLKIEKSKFSAVNGPETVGTAAFQI